jgi:hypothetical protein
MLIPARTAHRGNEDEAGRAITDEITGQSAKQLIAGLTEIDSEIQMEYGLILPKPGDEPKWFADNADALDGISGTGRPASDDQRLAGSLRKASTSAANSAWCWNRNPCAESG